MAVFAFENYVSLAVFVVMLAVKLFAFVSSLLYPADAYEAAGKLNKPTWCGILGVAVLLEFVPLGLMIINVALLVAALVYLADARPAMASLRRR